MRKAERERAQAALERAQQDAGMDVVLKPEKIVAFTTMMRDILADRDNPTRKAYLSAPLAAIEVDSDRIRIAGSRDILLTLERQFCGNRAGVRAAMAMPEKSFLGTVLGLALQKL